MYQFLVAFTDSGSIFPEDPSARVLWAVIGVVILGLYFLMKAARRRPPRITGIAARPRKSGSPTIPTCGKTENGFW